VSNAVAVGSAYVVGAWAQSFMLVLVVHHEVQHIAYAYATARGRAVPAIDGLRANLRLLASFAIWPGLGLASWALGRGWDPAAAGVPFLTAGLLTHYWLDGRIWTARASARLAGRARSRVTRR